ncbi:MAG: hypothetical protein KAI16_01260 [Candidatus Pacebacteria bacterium]|nr:hypothetical protein [Candidatus Paceibacterota bacterium]
MSEGIPKIYIKNEKDPIVIVSSGCISPTGKNTKETHENALKGKTGLRKLTPKDIANFELMAKVNGATTEEQKRNFFNKIWAEGCGVGAPIPENFIPAFNHGIWPKTAIDRKNNEVLMGDAMKLLWLSLQEIMEKTPQLFGEDKQLKTEKLRKATMVDIGNGAGSAVEKIEQKILEISHTGDPNVYGEKRYLLHMLGNMLAGQIANNIGAGGGHSSSNSACASAGVSMSNGFNSIISEASDIVFWGGAETATRAVSTYISFDRIMGKRGGALAKKWEEDKLRDENHPLLAFGGSRDGFVPGDYGGLQIMMRRKLADEYNLKYCAEVLAVSQNTCNPLKYGKAQTDGTIRGQAELTEKLFQRAGISPNEIKGRLIHYMHGTGTIAGGINEIYAAAKYLGELALDKKYIITSNKERHGHSLGAAFVDSVIEACEAIQDKKIAGMYSTKEIDFKFITPQSEIFKKENLSNTDITPEHLKAISEAILLGKNTDLFKEDLIMCDAKGFGGTNAACLLKPIF